jgi:demethoxyubiquinone hydroxylase (CLK1/Coq7/Cat5 family)
MSKSTWSLQFMYSMERFATAVYQAQKGGFHTKEILEKITYAVENEQEHANSLKARLIDLKKRPFTLAFLFRLAGSIVGCISRCGGNKFALRAGVVIEERAVKDYSHFLRTLILDDHTRSLIRRIIGDEERHIANWQDSLRTLKRS